MIRFESDYLEGAVPEIMSRLIETNYEQTAGYGTDPYCRAAREKIKLECNAFDADIHFLVGGTQANLTVIAASLRPSSGRYGGRNRAYRGTRDRCNRSNGAQGHNPRDNRR